MTTDDINAILDKVKNEAVALAISAFKSYKKQATLDAQNLVNALKANLQVWIMQLATGAISKDDFDFLVKGQNELVEMVALKQAGLAKIQTDELKNRLLQLIIKTVFGLV